MSNEYPIASSAGKLKFIEGGDILTENAKINTELEAIVLAASSGVMWKLRWTGGAASVVLLDREALSISASPAPILTLGKGEQTVTVIPATSTYSPEGTTFSFDTSAYVDMNLDGTLICTPGGNGNLYARVLLRKWHD